MMMHFCPFAATLWGFASVEKLTGLVSVSEMGRNQANDVVEMGSKNDGLCPFSGTLPTKLVIGSQV